jgi:diguanylate cyclase (GGDEF)-like protein
MSNIIKILLVEDDEFDRMSVMRALKRSGKEVKITHVYDATSGLSALLKGTYDCIILDYQLPDINGIEFLDLLEKEVPVIMLTDMDDENLSINSVKHGAQDYLVKEEVNGRSLLRAVRYAIERQRLTAAIKKLSLIDYLTGLYNRRGFMLFAKQQILLANRKNKKMCLFFCDIDGLKFINDTYGHDQGDRLIASTAKIIKDSFRASDIVARIGGDEFAILAFEATIKSSKKIIQHIEENLKGFNDSNRDNFKISLSIGISQYDPDLPDTIERLLIQSDKRMYEAKKRKLLKCNEFSNK